MENYKIDQYIMMMSPKVPAASIPAIRQRLALCQNENNVAVAISQMKDPTISLILSICLGAYGVDRFYVGDAGLGIGKLLTCGGIGIWWLIDIFMIMDATRNKNLQYLNYI